MEMTTDDPQTSVETLVPGEARRITQSEAYHEPQPFQKIADHLEQDFMLTHVAKRAGQEGAYYLLNCIDLDTAEAFVFVSSHQLLVPIWDEYARNPDLLPVMLAFTKRGRAFFVR